MTYRKKYFAAVSIALVCSSLYSATYAQVLLNDNFTGSNGAFIDTRLWRVPDGGDGASYGKTTVKTDQSLIPTIGGNAGVLKLETFLPGNTPGNPNNRFYGAEFQSRSSFAFGGGLRWETRARLGSSLDNGTTILPPASGLVGGAFLFDVVNPGAPILLRDELDFELFSKQTTSIFTNLFNDDGFSSAGDGELLANPVGGFSPFVYHDYKIEWTPGKVQYFVDGISIRTETNPTNIHVPDDPMTAHFNLWGPDSSFTDAFDPTLLPSGTLAGNKTYTMSVDNVTITRFNTASGPNKALNGSFEEDFGPEWFNVFNEASISTEAGGANGGAGGMGSALKLFDPFNSGFDASGAQQKIMVSPGDQVSASIFAFMPSGDSIAPSVSNPIGTRFTQMVLSFLNNSDTLIEERIITMHDSRDPNIGNLDDQWIKYTNEWRAPAGSTNAQVSLYFISDTGTGAVFLDELSLVNLTALAVPGDFDNDGDVDGRDFLVWQRGGSPSPFSPGDLATWQGAYNGGALSAVNAVPEPASLALLAACGVLLASRRGRRAC